MNLYKKYTLFTLIFLLWFKKHYVSRYYFKKLLLCIPYISAKIYKINHSLKEGFCSDYVHYNKIPSKSLDETEVENKISTMKPNSIENLSGVIYNNDSSHNDLLLKIFKGFIKSNPLHPQVFPEIRNMEVDIVQMVSNMFDGNENTCGNVTTGGTESILLACYTYREYCKKEYGITKPNIVSFHSIHPAFDKACHYFGIKLRKADKWWKLKWLINWNTVCVVGSAPTYGYGDIDPIVEMSEYCLKLNIPFHVDCCMGGFIVPFLENNVVSFRNEGITSISADTHKYGNCFKGSSVLLFSHSKIKIHQHFVKTDWEGGMYATPTMMGSKSGALIAVTWASLLYMGSERYIKIAYNTRKLLRKVPTYICS